ncbi:MAG TPA: SgcJ/EcaC family oxidoreductase [Thermomicrobiales bacterium]|nr:SgcJ/EcaC family oxidoreductase [Thermomicrobiales bacterium]
MTNDDAVRELYAQLLTSWNQRDAQAYAALLAGDGLVIGFDGSTMHGPAETEQQLGQIFGHHQTAPYYWKVRRIRELAPGVAVLHAVVGMVPPGQSDINPATNAIQTMTAVQRDGQWRIALFQNTPAAFHGRPEASEALTQELREVYRAHAATTG